MSGRAMTPDERFWYLDRAAEHDVDENAVAKPSDWSRIAASVTLGYFPVKVRADVGPAYTENAIAIHLRFDTPDFWTGKPTTLSSTPLAPMGVTVRQAREFVRKAVIDGLRHEIDEHLAVDGHRWDPHQKGGPQRYTPPDAPERMRMPLRGTLHPPIYPPVFDEVAFMDAQRMDDQLRALRYAFADFKPPQYRKRLGAPAIPGCEVADCPCRRVL